MRLLTLLAGFVLALPLSAQDAPPKPYDKWLPRLGYKRDLPRAYRSVFQAPEGLVKAPPPRVVNSTNAPPCLDQGRIGSCGLNAWANLHWDALRRAGLKPYVASRLYLYYRVRQMEGGDRAIRRDTGISIGDLADVAERWGSPPEEAWPYDDAPADERTELWPPAAKARQRPTAAVDAIGKRHNARCAHVRGDLASLKLALASGRPVEIGFTVFSSFFDPVTGAPVKRVPMPRPGDSVEGGHAVLAWDYDDAKAEFKCQNSWGSAVQDRGWFTMPYAFAAVYSADYLVIDSVERSTEAHHVPPASAAPLVAANRGLPAWLCAIFPRLCDQPEPPPPPSGDDVAALLTLHNAERAKVGSPPLSLDARLVAAAKDGADRMARASSLDHFIDGTTPWTRISAAGYAYSAAGENIAVGANDAATTVGDWMNSGGHRNTLLSRQYTQVGFAKAAGLYRPDNRASFYWVADFGRP